MDAKGMIDLANRRLCVSVPNHTPVRKIEFTYARMETRLTGCISFYWKTAKVNAAKVALAAKPQARNLIRSLC